MSSPRGGKSAIILSGGGAYGAYEIGVMRALFEGRCASSRFEPLDPDILTGTSAGAFNAALLLSAGESDVLASLSYVQDVYLNEVGSSSTSCGNGVLRFRGLPSEVFDEGCYSPNPLRPLIEFAEDATFITGDLIKRASRFMRSRIVDLEQRTLELVNLEAYTSADRFVELVNRRVIPANIRNSGKTLQVLATNWITGDVRVFQTEDFTDEIGCLAVLASTAIPGIFPSVDIEDQPYVDGGLVMNTPLRPPVEAGADTLHVINVDPSTRALPLSRLRSTATTVYRMMVIAFAAMLDHDIEIAGRINAGIDILQMGARGEIPKDPATSALQLILGSLPLHMQTGLPYRKLTVHRYHPKADPGGTLRWLSFGRDHLAQLIEAGYQDAIEHDCDESGCILADPSERVRYG